MPADYSEKNFALDKLLGLLVKVIYGEIEHDEGVCLIFDQVYEIIEKLRSIRHYKGQNDYDALEIEIFCSVQDLVRGPPIWPSLIPLELQNFRTNMMGAIRNLISAPLSPPNLSPMVPVHNTESHEKEANDDSNIESHVGDDGGSGLELVNEDDERSNIVGNNKESVNKVADEDIKQADNLISFDTIKMFDIVDAIMTKHRVSPREPTCGIDSISHVPQFAPRSKMVEDSKSGLLLWFSILSPVLKHEWKPPP
ncbi:hypothetical protein DM860_009829 [Cuscuta australis]|uniref:Uncharacterized protein n=1 Tax=Cuscuta australis TaxID=267555 RepID=A0A328DB50_9ASTE|nr:hypothetical protein DM860_009829 [Cuscuta australis]